MAHFRSKVARAVVLVGLGLHACRSFSVIRARTTIAAGHYVIPNQYGRILKDTTLKNLQMSQVEEDQKVSVAASPMDVERPDPSDLLSAQPDNFQRLGFIAICVSILAGTVFVVNLLTGLENLLPDGWFEVWRDFTWPLPLGLIFSAAGVAHFAMKDSFTAMVPPKGSWGGLWQVPAPGADKLGLTYEDFHTYWTGICEIGGGILLIIGGFNQSPQIPAFLLFLLTATVTPANIYMATHDVQPPGQPPIPYPWGHIGRFAAQSVLLGLFLKLAFQ